MYTWIVAYYISQRITNESSGVQLDTLLETSFYAYIIDYMGSWHRLFISTYAMDSLNGNQFFAGHNTKTCCIHSVLYSAVAIRQSKAGKRENGSLKRCEL